MGKKITMEWNLNNLPEDVVMWLIKDASFEMMIPDGDKGKRFKVRNPSRIVIEPEANHE